MKAWAISKMTLFSFLLAVMLGLGIWIYSDGHRDACSAYLAGDSTAPATMYVESGTRTVVIPCNDWILRQRLGMQLACFGEVALAAVFLMNGMGDVREWLERRRQIKARF